MTCRQKAVLKCVGRYSPAIVLALWAVFIEIGFESRWFKIIMLLVTASSIATAETIRIHDKKRRHRERQRARETHTS